MKDGKRIFGDNKTVIGFISMIIFCTVYQLICGILCNALGWNDFNHLYRIYENTVFLNLSFGFLVGIAYVSLELPNSFIKRRLDVDSGKHGAGFIGALFFVIDQIDSLLGVFLILCFFSDIGVSGYFIYLGVGAISHIMINVVLRFFKLRKTL